MAAYTFQRTGDFLKVEDAGVLIHSFNLGNTTIVCTYATSQIDFLTTSLTLSVTKANTANFGAMANQQYFDAVRALLFAENSRTLNPAI